MDRIPDNQFPPWTGEVEPVVDDVDGRLREALKRLEGVAFRMRDERDHARDQIETVRELIEQGIDAILAGTPAHALTILRRAQGELR